MLVVLTLRDMIEQDGATFGTKTTWQDKTRQNGEVQPPGARRTYR